MQNAFRVNFFLFTGMISILASGCQTGQPERVSSGQQPSIVQMPGIKTASPVAVAPSAAIRIKAGSSQSFTDSSGYVWAAEQGFDGGDIIERDPAPKIENTKDPGLFVSEHYGMNSFSCKIPNGDYTAKLYFAETFDGITGPGQRVFSFNVQWHEFKDFDVWTKAGGPNRAYIETVPVTVTNEVFRIDFTTQVENPQINALELIPQS